MEKRSIAIIASEIKENWKTINPAALAYLNPMLKLDKITDYYFQDSAEDIVMRFLANAQYWRGNAAKRLKSELKELLK